MCRLKPKKIKCRIKISNSKKKKNSLIFLHNTFKSNISCEAKLKSIQKKHFFCVESIQLCRNLSTIVLYEKLNLLVLSKLKPKNHSSLYRFILLLSGDVELNPGPTNYPCTVCGEGVRSRGVFCTQCGLWVHPKCENISNTEYKKLSKIPPKEFNFTCYSC